MTTTRHPSVLLRAAAWCWPALLFVPGMVGAQEAQDLPKSWVNPPPAKKAGDWQPEKRVYQTPERAPLVALGPDGRLVYRPFSDKGDRIIDFSYSGYRRSEAPIPSVPVKLTLNPPAGVATAVEGLRYPVGTDSLLEIQAAIDAVAAMPADVAGFRGAVLLTKGHWYLSGGLSVPSGVVLRGEGSGEDGTVLLFTMPEGNGVGILLGTGGGTQVSAPIWLTGTVAAEQDEDGGKGFSLTLEDGYVLALRTPRAEWKLDGFVGKPVSLRFQGTVTVQGGRRSVTLRRTWPEEAREVQAGTETPAADPDLVLPERKTGDRIESPITDAYVPTGAMQVTVQDASGFKVGDSINVIKRTNAAWIELLGVGERLRHIRGGTQGAGKKPWGPGAYGHPRQITAIDGATLTLDVPLPQSIVAEHGGGIVEVASAGEGTRQCGVEHLRVVSNFDPTQTSNDKQANYRNLSSGIEVSECRDAWIRGCAVLHTVDSSITVGGSRFVTVRDCASLQPVGPVRGGKRYSFNLGGGSMGILFYKCHAEDGRHDFVLGARTQGPSAFVDCTAVRGGQSEPHHRWSCGALYDNIDMRGSGSLAAINRGDSGSGHGWSGGNIVFWNCAAPNIVVADPESEGENNFVFGYKGTLPETVGAGGLFYANTRAGYWGTPQEGRFYGYPAMGSGHIESPDAPMPVDSLFRQQLVDRIGQAQAEAALR